MKAPSVRQLGILGLVFIALLLGSVFVAPNLPSTTASAGKVVKYYHDNKSAVRIEAYVIVVAVTLGLFYFWLLRDYLAAGSNRAVATVGFAGAAVFGVAGALAAGVLWASADGVGHYDAASQQVLNSLQLDGTAFLIGAGAGTMVIAWGICAISGSVLPTWVGWLGIVLGIATVVLPFGLGPLFAAVWLLVVSIILLTRSGTPTTATAAPAAQPGADLVGSD